MAFVALTTDNKTMQTPTGPVSLLPLWETSMPRWVLTYLLAAPGAAFALWAFIAQENFWAQVLCVAVALLFFIGAAYTATKHVELYTVAGLIHTKGLLGTNNTYLREAVAHIKTVQVAGTTIGQILVVEDKEGSISQLWLTKPVVKNSWRVNTEKVAALTAALEAEKAMISKTDLSLLQALTATTQSSHGSARG